MTSRTFTRLPNLINVLLLLSLVFSGNILQSVTSLGINYGQVGNNLYVQVSSPSSLAVLAESYPPSAGSFKPEVSSVMQQLLQFLEATRSPFWINAYPYFAYKDNPDKIPIDYVLFNRNVGMTDPNTKLHYDNMMYAQVDAFRVAETGWPSKGDAGEVGASPANAATYNRNLMMRQFAGEGTPARRNSRLDVYIFALFNEDMKPGPTSEKNYGIFRPDGSLAYNLGFSTMSTTTANSESVTYSSYATKVQINVYYMVCFVHNDYKFVIITSSLFSVLTGSE
ncbi:hypothetical protein Bca52824_089762 [Brassica carinata]|uniref:glucan endo-1,3-beta-D-glucosidase n=1 Tax=Brassica carinata TaxID=52824 RepID=A0A8X7NUL0_BRACI|nr:hypothetical protein Bca52824_089762 [Brassica carinata]